MDCAATLQWSNNTIPDRTNLNRFPYCTPTKYDYAWSDDVTYLNNSCIPYLLCVIASQRQTPSLDTPPASSSNARTC